MKKNICASFLLNFMKILPVNKFKSTPVGTSFIDIIEQFVVEGVTAYGGAVANDHKFFSCPGHRHIHPPDIGQKSDFALFVRSYQADINNIPFLPLERIHRIDTKASGNGIGNHPVFYSFPQQGNLGFIG